MATLADLLDGLGQLDGENTIYVAEPWTARSKTYVALDDSDEAAGALQSGLKYFFEVSIAMEVLEVWAAWRAGREPSSAERCDAVIHYATHDAYQPVD